TNSHLEAWGPFGRGWSLVRYSAQIVEPQAIPLIGYPRAWSPGFDQPLVADVIFLDAKNDADLEKYKGKLKGKIVLTSTTRELKARFEPLAARLNETNLLRLANAGEPQSPQLRFGRTNTPPADNLAQDGPTRQPRSGRGRGGAGASRTNAEPSTNITQAA